MKKLLVIRHAKSSHDVSGIPDHERPLENRGKHDCKKMGNYLKCILKDPIDMVFCSNAKRAKETFDGLEEHIPYKQYLIEPDLYHISYDDLQSFVNSVDDSYNYIAVVAHNPGITNFYNLYAEELTINIPTLGIFLIEADIDQWKSFSPENAKVRFLIYPKKL